jgi:hypothetical protein
MTKCGVRRRNFSKHVGGKRGRFHFRAHFTATSADLIEGIRLQRLDTRTDREFPFHGGDEALECPCLDDETGRHGNSGALQLSETPALATDLGAVVQPDIGKPTYDFIRRHHMPISAGPQRRWIYGVSSTSIVTTPRPPSTRILWPSLIREVALPVPTTAGKPYSRATMAA